MREDNFFFDTISRGSVPSRKATALEDQAKHKVRNEMYSYKRLARHMGERERKIIIFSFILCHFSYSPLILMLCSKGSQVKLKKFNERALRLAYSDYFSSY